MCIRDSLFHTGRSDQRRLLGEAGHPDGVGLGLVLRAAGSKPGRPTRRPRGGRLRLSDGEAERAPGITLRGPASDAADSWARVTLDPGGGDVPAPDRNVVGIIRGRTARADRRGAARDRRGAGHPGDPLVRA